MRELNLKFYKSLNGLGPKYLLNLLIPYQPSRTLRPSGKGRLTVYSPETQRGKASFRYRAAYFWNKLPKTLRCAPNVATFKSRLKTFLFCQAYEMWWWVPMVRVTDTLECFLSPFYLSYPFLPKHFINSILHYFWFRLSRFYRFYCLVLRVFARFYPFILLFSCYLKHIELRLQIKLPCLLWSPPLASWQ